MDDLERRLREYDEYNRAQISEEFLQLLKTLEANPEAAQRPRRRYVLPIAAAVALAICLGSLWAWLHFSRPVESPKVTLEEPALPDADSPAAPSEPAPPETKPKTELIYTSKPPAEEPSPTLPIFAPKPVQGGTAQPNSDTPAAPRSEEPAPAAPEDTTPVKPEDTAPYKPDKPTPGKPDNPNPASPDASAPSGEGNPPESDPPVPSEETNPPDDPNPPKPDDPDPPEPANPDPPDPPEADPSVDPPAVVKLESPFSAEFRREEDRDMVTLTLLSTGEQAEVDVTGWVASSGQAASAGEHPDDPQTQNGTTGSWVAVAFHQPVYIQFTVDGDGTVHTEAYYLTDYINHITQSIPGKENEDET